MHGYILACQMPFVLSHEKPVSCRSTPWPYEVPWPNGCYGSIRRVRRRQGFLVKQQITLAPQPDLSRQKSSLPRRGPTTLEITELPIKKWTQAQKHHASRVNKPSELCQAVLSQAFWIRLQTSLFPWDPIRRALPDGFLAGIVASRPLSYLGSLLLPTRAFLFWSAALGWLSKGDQKAVASFWVLHAAGLPRVYRWEVFECRTTRRLCCRPCCPQKVRAPARSRISRNGGSDPGLINIPFGPRNTMGHGIRSFLVVSLTITPPCTCYTVQVNTTEVNPFPK